MRDGVRNYSIGTFIWGSPIVFFVWGLLCSSNRHVTPVSVRGRKGLTCSIRAPPCPRFDTLRQTVSNRAQLFLAVYVASRPEVVDGAAPNHVSLRRAHERYLGCDHATYSYDGNAICDRICENRPPCKICTLEIRAFERGHVVLDPNFFYCTTVILGPLATSWWSLTVISVSVRALQRETCSLFERPVIV